MKVLSFNRKREREIERESLRGKIERAGIEVKEFWKINKEMFDGEVSDKFNSVKRVCWKL